MQRKFPILRKLILLIGDVGLLLLAGYLALLAAFYYRQAQPDFDMYYSIVPVMLVVAGILFNINGLFSLARKKYSEILLSLAVAIFNLLIIMMAASFIMREFSYARSEFFFAAILEFVLLALWKYVFWRLERALITPKVALLIGSKEECVKILTRLSILPYLKYKVRYICTQYEDEYEPLGKISADVDLVIVCSQMSLKEKADIVNYCHDNSKQIFFIPEVYELFCSGIELEKIDDIPVFCPHYLKASMEQRFLKRMLDIIVAGVGLLFTGPIMFMVAIAIKINSPGPIFYSQIRTGRDEKEFRVYKFRSMRQDAEKSTGPILAAENDPRITKVGNFLRTVRLDELPQLFNVLLGDMSMVGPRPERPVFVAQFKNEIVGYQYRHNVKPGITGMAQVHGKYNTAAKDKLIYDLLYIQKCSVVTDLIIMLQTVRVLLMKSSTEGVGTTLEKVDLAQYQQN